MANNHVISIEKAAHLSIDLGRLQISFPNSDEKHFVATFDIAVLILAHPQIILSSAVFKELSSVGAVILHSGNDFMPIGFTMPVGINIDGAKRPHQQAKHINAQSSQSWHRQIIKSKILGQAFVLSLIDKEKAKKLFILADRVLDGDKDNKEAFAAKYYWEYYFKALSLSVSRQKQGACDIANSCLNYSYSVIRSIIARSLAGAGLCLNFGIFHSRKDNPFNLVEDFVEPFRFIADKEVFEILSSGVYERLETKLKRELLSRILKTTVIIEENRYRLFQAIDFAINSFCVSLEDPRRKLLLPNSPSSRGAKPSLPELFHIKHEN
jgi:CRISPR-associated protein Cas1